MALDATNHAAIVHVDRFRASEPLLKDPSLFMKHLTNLFKLLELTRSQTQYGYALEGIQRDEISNLAEHHYLVTFTAWQLARQVQKAGAKVDIQKVLEFCLVHDLGELLGGDIAMPYGQANPKAKKLAKAFEEENQLFFARFFGDDAAYFTEIAHDILDVYSDEGIIAKLADYIEMVHYKQYVRVYSKKDDVELALLKIQTMLDRLHDPIAKVKLTEFIKNWSEDLDKKTVKEILYEQREE